MDERPSIIEIFSGLAREHRRTAEHATARAEHLEERVRILQERENKK